MVKNGDPLDGGDSRDLYAHWTEIGLAISGFGLMSAPCGARDSRSDGEQVVVLSFASIAGVDYEIQWAPSLDGGWTVLKRWAADEDGETPVTVEVPSDSSGGFFRLLQSDADAE